MWLPPSPVVFIATFRSHPSSTSTKHSRPAFSFFNSIIPLPKYLHLKVTFNPPQPGLQANIALVIEDQATEEFLPVLSTSRNQVLNIISIAKFNMLASQHAGAVSNNVRACAIMSSGVRSEDGQLARIGENVKKVCMGYKEGHGFGGVKVGARHAHVGQGLGVGISGSNGSRWSAATWLDNRAKVDADVPVSDAWELWNDRERIPRWMKWINTVKVSKQKPDFSKWTLRYKAFGRDFEFSWLARNLEPVHHQKIQWQSVDGLPNRGAVRFIPRGPKACTVELTISYELPDIVAPLGTAVSPIVDRVLQQDMDRFAKYTKTNQLSRL